MNTKFETLLGCAEVPVRLVSDKGGDKGFVGEVVQVRQLPVKAYPRLLEIQGDEQEQVCLYCDRDMAWVERLMPESHERIIVKAEELNGDFFGRWAARQTARIERIRPGLSEKLFAAAAAKAPAASSSSAPKLQPIAGLPGSRPASAASPG